MTEDGGSYWVSVLVGLIFMLFISPFFPVAGPIAGGIVGGYLGPPGAVRGALGGLIVAAVFSVIAVVGGTAFLGPAGTLIGLGIAVVLFALALYFGLLGAVGGAIGGALKAWVTARRQVTG